jgi:hypothetical protein
MPHRRLEGSGSNDAHRGEDGDGSHHHDDEVAEEETVSKTAASAHGFRSPP